MRAEDKKPIFQSTPSAWRVTIRPVVFCSGRAISIHTLRMEGDLISYHLVFSSLPFQSTPSAWRVTIFSILAIYLPAGTFQSTPSAWRVTRSGQRSKRFVLFQSTPSARWVTILLTMSNIEFSISIHTLRMEGDRSFKSCTILFFISIHTLRMEGD